jgi:hypothetical protein
VITTTSLALVAAIENGPWCERASGYADFERQASEVPVKGSAHA